MKRFVRLCPLPIGILLAVGLVLALEVHVQGTGAWGQRPGSDQLTDGANHSGAVPRHLASPWIQFAGPVALGDAEIDVWAIAAGDLDWDGDLDLVSTGLLAWRNPYPATFSSPWVSTTLEPGVDALDVALADMDHDGDLDVVAGGPFGVAVWQNPWDGGQGTPFGTWPISHALTTTQLPIQKIVVADLDRDGWLDVAAVRGTDVSAGGLCAWRNPHAFNGTWTANVIAHTPGLQALAVGDLDHDGWEDLVSGSGTYAAAQEIRAWHNDRTPFAGGWDSHQIVDVWDKWGGDDVRDVVLADLDDNGMADVIARFDEQTWGTLGLWRNPGAPFDAPWTRSATMVAGERLGSVAVGDLDHDGDLDLASVDHLLVSPTLEGAVRWWQNDRTPFQGGWRYERASVSGVGLHDVLLRDLDKNGALDTIAAGRGHPTILVWVAPSTRTFLPVIMRRARLTTGRE